MQAGEKYRVKTGELRNGIDTYLRILDEKGVLVDINGKSLENDDAFIDYYFRNDSDCGAERFFNDKVSLASLLEFTAEISGRYYVEVSHISTDFAKFGSVGSFGSYRLTVAQLLAE